MTDSFKSNLVSLLSDLPGSKEYKEGMIDNILDFMQFNNAIDEESDRGCALMAASYLDFLLEMLLKSKLIGSKSHLNSLFGLNGALGNFSSKITLSYSIGILSKRDHDDINIIRKIRNVFGHSAKKKLFNDKDINSYCNLLKSHITNETTPRSLFNSTVAHIVGNIVETLLSPSTIVEKSNSDIEAARNRIRPVLDSLNKFIIKMNEQHHKVES